MTKSSAYYYVRSSVIPISYNSLNSCPKKIINSKGERRLPCGTLLKIYMYFFPSSEI
jgi:hypothetical protein